MSVDPTSGAGSEPAPPTSALLRLLPLIRQMLKFLAGTLVGLAVDLGVYTALVALGLEPGIANAISSACAVVVMYFLSTRLIFGGGRSPLGFLLFCGWYVISIAGFSLLVQAIHVGWEWPAIWAKIGTLPLSFLANFVAVRVILATQRKGRE